MLMAMENLVIAQYEHTLKYTFIGNGTYKAQLQRFKVAKYVYLQWEAPTILDVWTWKNILMILLRDLA